MGIPLNVYSYYRLPKRKWYEKLLGLNNPKYSYTIIGPFEHVIY